MEHCPLLSWKGNYLKKKTSMLKLDNWRKVCLEDMLGDSTGMTCHHEASLGTPVESLKQTR